MTTTIALPAASKSSFFSFVALLLGAAALGLRNVLAITGDPPKLGPYPQATAVFDVDAIGLVNIIKRLNEDFGKTVVMVTHDPHAASYAHVTRHLEKGKLLPLGD